MHHFRINGVEDMIQSELLNLGPEHDKFLNAQRNQTSKQKDLVIISHERYHKTISNYLPEGCKSILDIGCGLGITDICLFEHYNRDEEIQFHYFDKTEFADELFFGYKKEAAFYNNLEMTKRLAVDYGIPESNITCIEATKNNLLGLNKMDLIISAIAWGFHFPISTYLEEVVNLMHDDSVLILDIRAGTGGMEELSKYFHIETILEKKKRTLVSCKKLS